MTDSLNIAGIFLIQTLFNLYLLVLLLRFVLQTVKADFYNPVTQFVIKLTDKLVLPLRRILRPYKNLDFAILLLLFMLEMVKIALITWLKVGLLKGGAGLVIWSMAELIGLFIQFYFYAVIFIILLSWLSPGYSPVVEVLFLVTEPLLRPFRRLIPPIASFDVTPIPLLLGLKLLDIVVVAPLMQIGISLL